MKIHRAIAPYSLGDSMEILGNYSTQNNPSNVSHSNHGPFNPNEAAPINKVPPPKPNAKAGKINKKRLIIVISSISSVLVLGLIISLSIILTKSSSVSYGPIKYDYIIRFDTQNQCRIPDQHVQYETQIYGVSGLGNCSIAGWSMMKYKNLEIDFPFSISDNQKIILNGKYGQYMTSDRISYDEIKEITTEYKETGVIIFYANFEDGNLQIKFKDQVIYVYHQPILTAFPDCVKLGYIVNGGYRSVNDEKIAVTIPYYLTPGVDDIIYYDVEYTPEAVVGLPVIEINTNGTKITSKCVYINCSFSIANSRNDITIAMKDKYGDSDSVGIRIHGNNNSFYKKKPYQIQFDGKQSGFGLEPNKNWLGLANYLDQSASRNYSAFLFGKAMNGLKYTNNGFHIVLYLNYEYVGGYLLTEYPDEKTGRAGIEEEQYDASDIDFPFNIEIDYSLGTDLSVDHRNIFHLKYYFDVYFKKQLSPVEIKYPSYEQRIIVDKKDIIYNYISEYIDAVFTLLETGGSIAVSFRSAPVSFGDGVDEDSFIDFWGVNTILHNTDSQSRGIKAYKHKTGKLTFGTIWDFEAAYQVWNGNPYAFNMLSGAESGDLYTKLIIGSYGNIDANYEKFIARFDGTKIEMGWRSLEEYKGCIRVAALFDTAYWYGSNADFDEAYDYGIDFLKLRKVVLERELTWDNRSKFGFDWYLY